MSRFEKTSEISTNDKETADNDNESFDGGAVESSSKNFTINKSNNNNNVIDRKSINTEASNTRSRLRLLEILYYSNSHLLNEESKKKLFLTLQKELDLTKNAKKCFLSNNGDQNVHEHQHSHHHHHHHHHHRHQNHHHDQANMDKLSSTHVDNELDDHVNVKQGAYKKHASPQSFEDDFNIEDQRLNQTKEAFNSDLKPQQVPTQNLVNRIKSQFNAASNSTYEQENPFRAELNNSNNNNNNHKLDNFIDNLARPTPEDKRRYFQFKNLALR